jgi:hypothetical protein
VAADEASLATGTWRVIGASVPGTAHTRAGLPCQDAHSWAMLPNGCLVVAVADGAGSAAHSDVGARLAADAALAHLSATLHDGVPTDEHGWQVAMATAFDTAARSLSAIAEETGRAVRDYATTLTLVVATPDTLVVGQIGDGIAVAEREDGELFLAATPQRGEYANEVVLLTAPDVAERLTLSLFPIGVRAFAATTDGLLRLAVRLPSYEPHPPFFAPLFAFVAESTNREVAETDLAAFLASERLTRRTDDDKTLVLATRIRESADEPTASAAAPDATAGG